MRKLVLITGLIFGFWLFMSSSGFAEPLGDARLSLIQGDVVNVFLIPGKNTLPFSPKIQSLIYFFTTFFHV
jgi:hypothetical protein